MGSLIGKYRQQWPRIGGAAAMALGGATALAAGKMSKPRLLSMLNFISLLVHQYEEYEDPGYFPGQFNRGLFSSDTPGTYPLNAHGTMLVNTAACYPFYLAPVLFPRAKWLGIAPALFGFQQVLAHGVLIPARAHARYSPGFLVSICLHLPIGILYLRTLQQDEGLTAADMAKGLAYDIAFCAVGIAAPNLLTLDKNSPNPFNDHQIGPYAASS